MKPAHYRGTFHVASRKVREAAYADPLTRCWRCNHTLPECKPHRNGKPAWWEAGHIIDGNPASTLAPECSVCNRAAGARLSNERRRLRRSVVSQGVQMPTSTRW